MKRNIDLIQLINNKYDKLSKSQKLIGDYIIDNYDQAAFMTAANLGKTIGVSESTIVRFSNRLGYQGYKQFQEDLQELIKNKLTTVQRIHMQKTNYQDKEELLINIIEKDIENIKKTITGINLKSFSKSIDIILKAENIHIVGLRSSSFLAGYLGFYLNFLFDNVNVVNYGPNDIFEQLLKTTSKDVIIIITYPRYSQKIIDVLEFVKKRDASVITITDSQFSPSAYKADASLIASSEMISFVDSFVAPMSLINAFIIALGNEKKDNLNTYFEDLEEIWKTYDIYNT